MCCTKCTRLSGLPDMMATSGSSRVTLPLSTDGKAWPRHNKKMGQVLVHRQGTGFMSSLAAVAVGSESNHHGPC